MKNIKLVLGILFLTSLSACVTPEAQSHYTADVTVFHELNVNPANTSIALLPWKTSQSDSLEYKAYSKRVAASFQQLGFNVVDSNENPDLVVFFDYGIDAGRQVVSSYSVPNFGVTGYSGGYTTGTLSRGGGYTATTTLTPQYGITGYDSGVSSSTVFTRYLRFDIAKPNGKKLTKLYEGQLTSSGSCSKLTTVLPNLLQMYFRQFPRESGTTKTEVFAWNGVC